jgi:hypothetical protein
MSKITAETDNGERHLAEGRLAAEDSEEEGR